MRAFAGLFTEDAAVAKLAGTMIGYASIALIFDIGQSLFAMSLRHGATYVSNAGSYSELYCHHDTTDLVYEF